MKKDQKDTKKNTVTEDSLIIPMINLLALIDPINYLNLMINQL